MGKLRLLIGGERSSGKTTLVNYLVSGEATSPFPRGVRGRLSLANRVLFREPVEIDKEKRCEISIRVGTNVKELKEFELSSRVFDCAGLLYLTVHDLCLHILRSQIDLTPTILSIDVTSRQHSLFTSVAEIGPESLRSLIDTGRIQHAEYLELIEDPDLYVHITSAIKPLAHVERQAILRFRSRNVPILLVVNKCDLVDDPDDLEEIEQLARAFTSDRGGLEVKCILCSFAGKKDASSMVASIEDVAAHVSGVSNSGSAVAPHNDTLVDKGIALGEVEFPLVDNLNLVLSSDHRGEALGGQAFQTAAAEKYLTQARVNEWQDYWHWTSLGEQRNTMILRKCLPEEELSDEYEEDYNLMPDERTILVVFERRLESSDEFLVYIPDAPHIDTDVRLWRSRLQLSMVTEQTALIDFCFLRNHDFAIVKVPYGSTLTLQDTGANPSLVAQQLGETDVRPNSSSPLKAEESLGYGISPISKWLNGTAGNPVRQARKLMGNDYFSEKEIEDIILSGVLAEYGIGPESIDEYETYLCERENQE